MTHILTVQGMQYGSEAKGAIALLAATRWMPDTVACAWQPNAGHTVYVGDRKFIHRMLPMGVFAESARNILIGPGATLDVNQLAYEVGQAADHLLGKRIIIHPNAAVLNEVDSENEAALVKIGSTMKGSMRAQVRKMERGAYGNEPPPIMWLANQGWCSTLPIQVVVSEEEYDRAIDSSRRLQLEGAQGFSLGIHEQFYPYCTSRDVSTAQLLADCRVPMPAVENITTIGVCRTFPIRVANRFRDGVQVGTSGPCYDDQRELSWEDIGRDPELTTVTKLPRRLFTFSIKQIQAAARIMQPDFIALTFCDYLGVPGERPWGLYMPDAVRDLVGQIEANTQRTVKYLTFGPGAADQWEVANEAGLLKAPALW